MKKIVTTEQLSDNLKQLQIEIYDAVLRFEKVVGCYPSLSINPIIVESNTPFNPDVIVGIKCTVEI